MENNESLRNKDINAKTHIENRFPDCLYFKMKLTGSQSNRFNIYLTINFNKQQVDLRLGTIWFGLRGGELRLNIQNGIIPYESRSLKSSFDIFLESKRKLDYFEKKKSSLEGSNSINVGTNAGIGRLTGQLNILSAGKKTKEQEGENHTQDEFNIKKWQISTKGPEDTPCWCFECESGQKTIQGTLDVTKLGTVHVSEKPFYIDAIFKTSWQNIVVTYTEDFWKRNITNNRKSIIKLLIHRQLRNKLSPYLSRSYIEYA